jgi:hypothetical protein
MALTDEPIWLEMWSYNWPTDIVWNTDPALHVFRCTVSCELLTFLSEVLTQLTLAGNMCGEIIGYTYTYTWKWVLFFRSKTVYFPKHYKSGQTKQIYFPVPMWNMVPYFQGRT